MRKREGRREFRRNRKGSNMNWKGMRRKRKAIKHGKRRGRTNQR